MFTITASSQAQSDNYIFYYDEPFAVFSKEAGFSKFSLRSKDPKTEKYKLNKALAKTIKFLWQYKENETPVKFSVEKFEFDPENDDCEQEAKVVLKGIEPNGFFTSKPLKRRVGSTLHEATGKENKNAARLVGEYLRSDGYKASAIAAILASINVSAVNLGPNERDSLIVQANLDLHKKSISMLAIITPGEDKQLEISFAEIYSSAIEAETEAVHIDFRDNIDMGDGKGDRILLELSHWENVDFILLSRPNNRKVWKKEISFNRGC